MSSCTSWFSLFLNRGVSSSPPSPPPLVHSPHQLVPTLVLQEPVPLSCQRRSSAAQPLKTRHIHCVSWSPYPKVKHPYVALSTEVCDLPRLVVLDEGLVLAQVDLISSLCDLGNAQERTLYWTNFPDDSAALPLIRSASHGPLASRRDRISPLRLGRSFLTSRPNSVSVESTASCSREARLPLRHCRQLQRSSLILS